VQRIGSYTVERKLGEGGMGTVWLARSRSGRLIAVKVARPELAGDPLFRERFRAEVAAARTVGGFHTAPVVDADPDADQPWLATAYVPGPTLARLLDERGPMDEERLRALGVALAEALQAIHRCGLVHRDLKPANIVMAEDGPRVLDFGIARAVEQTRLTLTGTAFGTPGFLAPEQAEGLDAGPAADVFALGAVLVAAAGGSAFGRCNPVALMYRSVHQEPDLGAVPEALRPVVAACLDKAPARRPDATRLLDWLSPSPDPGTVPAEPTAYELTPPAPRPAVPPRPALAPAMPPGPGSAYPPAAGYGPPPAPEFLAMDRKNAVVADASGVSLGTDGRVLAFPWPEIDQTWSEPLPGRRPTLVVAVSLYDGALHTCEVGTRRPAELAAWQTDFAATAAHFLSLRR
jgi:serine/threonine protein kinase